MSLTICSWAFDGKFECVYTSLKIQRIQFRNAAEGLLQINSLPVVPLKLSEDGICEYLESRGKAFWEYRHNKFVSYSGPTEDSEDLVVSVL